MYLARLLFLPYYWSNKCSHGEQNFLSNSILQKRIQKLTSAEGFIGLWVEAPCTWPSCGDLKTAQHPWLIWWKKLFQFNKKKTNMCFLLKNVGDPKRRDLYLDWSCWKEKQVISLHSLGSEKCPPNTTWKDLSRNTSSSIRDVCDYFIWLSLIV